MNLSELSTTKHSKGRVMNVEHPSTGEPLCDEVDGKKVMVTIQLLSQDSDPYKAASKKAADRRLAQQLKRGGRKLQLSSTDLEADSLEILVASTVGWENVVLSGEALPFSTENARRLYRELPWIKEQADAFIGDRGNFLGE